MNTFNPKISLVKGKGSFVFDSSNKKYIDLIGGIGCCSTGHANPKIAKAVKNQSMKIINPSNLFGSEEKSKLAEKLSSLSFLENVFLSNSGTEAVETAIKLAKKFTKKKEIISMKNAFHGRTMGSLSATWKEKYKHPFEPLLNGFSFAEYSDVLSIENLITKDTAAVIIEPIQGEGGVIVPYNGYLKEVKELCVKNDILLILDEVQTGNGRTGKYFCFEHEKIVPDILVTAKGLANGFPIGATMSGVDIKFEKGDHNSTFGGNSVSAVAALKNIELIEEVLPFVKQKGDLFKKKILSKTRGVGLMIGVKVDDSNTVLDNCAKNGVLLSAPNESTLRLLPSLNIKNKEINLACKKINESIGGN
jgi:predicted acetylornithine/succinylornithine family transaminase